MGKLAILYGHKEEDMAIKIMEALDVAQELEEISKNKDPYIGLKPNLVIPQPSDWGATTSPDLTRGVIQYLLEHGFENIAIMEGSWIGDSTDEAFQACGYEDISREFGIPLINLQKDTYSKVDVGDLTLEVCTEPLQADYLINLPVVKAHCQTRITCALKNIKGCIPNREKRRFHRIGLHKPIGYLSKALTPHLTIADGIIGDLSHEEGGNPVRMGICLASRDPVLMDAYVAELLGFEVDDIPYIGFAAQMGVGDQYITQDKILELNSLDKEAVIGKIEAGSEIDYLQQWIQEDQACSPCFAGLVHAMMRLKERNQLGGLTAPLIIGQGYKGQKAKGLGIGICASGCTDFVSGCPPKGKEIVQFLEKYFS